MKRHTFLIAAMLAAVIGFSMSARAQQDVKESSTGTLFPATVTFQRDSVDYELDLSGMSVRSKFFVKVYAIAHYMNAAGFENRDAALEAAMSDEYAKQITMVFVRGVEAEKIQNAFFDGFKKNATEEELVEIESLVDQFVGYFLAKTEEGDRYVFRSLPGGTILASVKGTMKEPIENPIFARVLWKIWLGKDSIVDRKKLVDMAISEE